MENTVSEQKKRNLPWFITKIVLNVIFYIVIIILLLFSIMNINAGSKNGGFPNIFGKGFLSVQTNSMERTGDLDSYGYNNYSVGGVSVGDLLYVDVVDGNKVNNLRVGDVITFKSESLNALNTHRIVYATYKDSNEVFYAVSVRGVFTVSDNTYVEYSTGLPSDVTLQSLSTEGDRIVCNSGVYDPTNSSSSSNNSYLVSSGNIDTFSSEGLSSILGIATGVSVGSGKVLENVQQNWLFYFVIPILIFLLIEIFLVIKNVMDLRGSKTKVSVEEQKEQMRVDFEAEKEKMRQQILAELNASKPVVEETPTVEETPDTEEAPVIEETTTIEETTEAEPVEEVKVTEEITEVEETIVEPVFEEPVFEEAPVVEQIPDKEEANVEEVIKVEEAPIKKAPAKKATTTAKSTTAKATGTKASTTKKATTKATTAKASTTKKADGEATKKTPAKKASTAKTTTTKATTKKAPVKKTEDK